MLELRKTIVYGVDESSPAEGATLPWLRPSGLEQRIP
jgi:hypothetical protein